MEIFDPFEVKNVSVAEEDKELVETDLPERYIYLLKK